MTTAAPAARGSTHIRPFFWCPEGLAEIDDTGEPRDRWGLSRFIEEKVQAMWDQMASPKNGAWMPIPQPRGWTWDRCRPDQCPQSGKPFSNNGRLNVTVLQLRVPPGHAYYKEGHVAYIIRHPDHSLVHWQRIEGVPTNEVWLPDEMAAKLAVEGKFKVLQYDTPEGAILEDLLRNPPEPTLEEQQEQEHMIRERGPARRVEVPLQ